MTQEIESEQDLHLQSLTQTIAVKIGEGAKKTESFFALASIYKVPEELRKMKESAYTPRLISIGPLHHNDKHLKTPMQYVKMSYTNDLLLRMTEGVTNLEWYTVLKECVAEMKLSIDDAKKCYAEEVTMDEEMLLVDGCFIIELLYRNYLKNANLEEEEEEGKSMHGGDSANTQAWNRIGLPLEVQESIKSNNKQEMRDPIYDSILTANTVLLDLLLLENQIPYFVLEKLFNLTIDKIPNHPNKETLHELARSYFGNMMSPSHNSKSKGSATTTNCGSPSDCVFWVFGNRTRNPKEEEVLSSSGSYYHILHKLHEDHLPRHPANKTDLSELMPSASNLDYAGVKFVPGTGRDLFNVKFTEPQGIFRLWCRAHFEIPTLGIYVPTEAFLRNLIAFEQCCPGVSQHFTSYAYLMDMLVNSEKDVERLERARVLHNCLGSSEDATDLFNKLCKETILGEFFFADTCNKATEYSKRSWPNFIARWKRRYYADKWRLIAIYLSFISLFASIAQVVIALMSLK